MRHVLVLIIAVAMALPAWAQEENDLGTQAQRDEGQVVYDIKCAHCHGYEGDAISVATPYLRPTPRDFTSGNYKFRSTSSGELPTTEDIKRSIRDGMPYTSMPAWADILSEAEITNLAYYIKSFFAQFDGPYGNPPVVEVPSAPSYSDDPEHLARGRAIFDANQCADCHGENGRGNGPSAPDLMDDWGYPIRPADMTKRWTYRASPTREDVYRTFMTGLNGTPMPSYEQSIRDEADRWALVDYVWSLSRDAPDYATMVNVRPHDGPMELSAELFEEAPESYFPIVGQVIEPGRAFYPGVNGIAVRAVYNASAIAIQLSWHDMTAETDGSNHPAIEVPMFDPAQPDSSGGPWSDAVAVLLPSHDPDGLERPYFMFGDSDFAMSIWHADLAADSATVLTGAGSDRITVDASLEHTARYADGVWTVAFKADRPNGELTLGEGTFVPVSFTVWDGLSGERGNKRGLSAWYHLYLEPMEGVSATGPMLRWALRVLLLELALVGLVRWRSRRGASDGV